jgi:hypothetical protein
MSSAGVTSQKTPCFHHQYQTVNAVREWSLINNYTKHTRENDQQDAQLFSLIYSN